MLQVNKCVMKKDLDHQFESSMEAYSHHILKASYQSESSSHLIHRIVTNQPFHLQLNKNGQCLGKPIIQALLILPKEK